MIKNKSHTKDKAINFCLKMFPILCLTGIVAGRFNYLLNGYFFHIYFPNYHPIIIFKQKIFLIDQQIIERRYMHYVQ